MSNDFSKEVEHVARLARLNLSADEKKLMAGQLSTILDTARRIQELDTEDVEPTSHVIDLPAMMREDLVQTSLPLKRVLQNAPRRHDDFFRVPSITNNENSEV